MKCSVCRGTGRNNQSATGICMQCLGTGDQGPTLSLDAKDTAPQASFSMRDQFAMTALTGLLANSGATPFGANSRSRDFASKAYSLADAMMEARNK